jgi:hypothetical protein
MEGTQYDLCGQVMPNLAQWLSDFLHLDFDNPTPPQKDMELDPPTVNEAFVEELGADKSSFSRRSFAKWERIMNSHG